jgi:translocation and assembly module TamA
MVRSPALPLAALLLLAACGGSDAPQPLTFADPETALDYDVELTGAPSDAIDALMRQSLDIFRRQEDGAQSLAFLRRRVAGDEATAQRILRSFGYFDGGLAYRVEEIETPTGEPRRASVQVTVEPGPPFILSRHGFTIVEDGGTPVDLADAAALGSPVGAPAVAQDILDAETRAVARLTHRGRPYARRLGREAVADLELAEIEIDTTIAAGPAYAMEPPRFEGLERVEADYLRTYLNWDGGEPFDQRVIDEYQRRLSDTRLFSAITVRPPETPPDGGSVPITVAVEEGPRRTVTAGLRYSTDRGPAARGTFEHRNLFGANETGRLDAFAGLDEQRLEGRYRVPQFLRHEQDFVAAAGVRRIEDDAFDELAFTTTAGIERVVSSKWTVGASGLFELTQTTDDRGDTVYMLFGLPVFAAYDSTRDFLNPVQGWRLRADVTPFMGLADDNETPLFTSIDTRASHYIALDSEDRYILAGRARLATIIAQNVDDVPSPRRLYSGGGGSVRGFAERSIGPSDANGDPSGGLSAVEAGIELRARVFGDIGGAVSEEVYFSVEDPSIAAGGGVRYFSPVGPIRVDVGVPLNPDEDDDDFQIYLSIGQAF